MNWSFITAGSAATNGMLFAITTQLVWLGGMVGLVFTDGCYLRWGPRGDQAAEWLSEPRLLIDRDDQNGVRIGWH